jgi:hypothetical protein
MALKVGFMDEFREGGVVLLPKLMENEMTLKPFESARSCEANSLMRERA